MRILIVGAGAMGGVTAAYMTKAGLDVTLLCRRETTAELIRSRGLRISGLRGEHSVPMPAVADPHQLEGWFDAVIIATKAPEAPAAAMSVLPWLAEGGLALFLQNGIALEAQTAAVGAERLACAVATWSCTMVGEAHMDITGEGGFIIGRPGTGADPRLEELKKALDTMAPTEISPDIFAAMFSKLIINSGITCGGALTGQRLGRMLLGRRGRRFFIAIAREDMAVADALGIKVPPFGGKLDYYRFITGDSWLDDLRRHITLLAVGLRYWRLKSSSLTALQRGRPTEAQALNGWISAQGAALGAATPVNDAVLRLVGEIEQGKRAISPDNLREIV